MSLTTSYLGLTLKNPLIASASPLNANLDNLRRLEDAGTAAIVLPSLFQEQIEGDDEVRQWLTEIHADSSPEALSYFPAAIGEPYGVGPERYLDLIRRGTEAVSIPIIASLNGSSLSGWTEYARLIETAGAAAVELNMYYVPTDLRESGQDIEVRYSEIVDAVCGTITLPVSVKLPSNLSAIGHFATSLVEHGAAGLVLFNRLMQPDIDLVHLKLTDTIDLSEPNEMRLSLLWTAILSGRITASLAASTGVSTSADVVKCLLAGADVVMTASALLRHDVGYMSILAGGLRTWMEERGIATLADMRGMMSWQRSRDPSIYTRANYIRILEHYAPH
ncbi:dihydroorotate dehydrogenase-like protein [Telmatospirillum siberiense]|uniref:Dihydroorotate dehydrogenase n=1 Tax=Telmatospirillum siberiense TaxID=382514 RepID=A0A2N3PRK9_9PROT|nr:dihydroorotate dehydrogenase-like protein [Telmatospirillum siberiense]PKU23040.1 dihydroorotate dehydrogenase [Telmatospirillum siberiense]